jgi:hypothetical protein
MAHETITADMRVWEVIRKYPETFEVFRRHGCPDMRHGLFAVSAHIMKVRWAARAHHIELDQLLHELNAAVEAKQTGKAA